jgi:hypothetical protein
MQDIEVDIAPDGIENDPDWVNAQLLVQEVNSMFDQHLGMHVGQQELPMVVFADVPGHKAFYASDRAVNEGQGNIIVVSGLNDLADGVVTGEEMAHFYRERDTVPIEGIKEWMNFLDFWVEDCYTKFWMRKVMKEKMFYFRLVILRQRGILQIENCC